MDAFKIKVHGKNLDYRLSAALDLAEVRTFFEKKYTVHNLWQSGRHVLGEVAKNGQMLFLKLATTEGISAVTQIEFQWNDQFNKLTPRHSCPFWVPQNYDSGNYQENLFYLVTDKFDGELLSKRPGETHVSQIFEDAIFDVIAFSELIQELPLKKMDDRENGDYQQLFLHKTQLWYNAIPENIREEYHVKDLLQLVENGVHSLQKKSRHGDLTPWHMMRLKTGQLGLIDGEHAMASGVAYYDIAYFIQRVFNELQRPDMVEKVFEQLQNKQYSVESLKVVLAARGIGGFLDDSLKPEPTYTFSERYMKWVKAL